MSRFAVCSADELPPGERRIVRVGGREVGVFNLDGDYVAIRNLCPHRSAPLCLGEVTGTMLPSEPDEYEYGMPNQILRCPWHGWEFEIRTGRSYLDPERYRVKTYPVTVMEGTVYVSVES